MLEQLLFKTFPPSMGWGEVGPVNRGMRQTCGLSKTGPSIGCLGNRFNRFLRSQSNMDFPGSTVVKILPFQYRGRGFDL